MNGLEWLAAGLGVVNIALLVRRSVWNFPFGIAMVTLYGAVFWDARLYAEAGLQGFFVLAQAWGWLLWIRAGGQEPEADRVPVRWLDWPSRAVWAMVTAALSLNLGWALHRFTDADLPYADSAIAGASVAAQILLALRRIENWIVWIAIDVAAIAVYIRKDLYPTAGLYGLFLAFSVMGLREWTRAARARA
jgi:nicotinamide mononucleotide transporter